MHVITSILVMSMVHNVISSAVLLIVWTKICSLCEKHPGTKREKMGQKVWLAVNTNKFIKEGLQFFTTQVLQCWW